MMSTATENVADREPGLQADQRLLDRGWLKIGAGLAVAAQAMVFSLAVNLSEVDNAWAYVVVHGILIAAALGSLVFLGGDLVRSAWDALRARRISIDLLFLVTLAGALGGSLIGTFTQTGSVYYEVVAVLIVVHTAGKMLGARSRVSALSAVDRTREKFDTCEVVGEGGAVSMLRVKDLAPGAIVRVAPGGGIAVDGEIVTGRGYIQETSMTGEWQPVSRGPGERVLAGTFSVDGSFEVRASAGARKLDAILSEVERARIAPSRLQAQADRLMAWFLPLVVGVSVLTFVYWWFHAPWERALFNAMAVLLVACPCAMGLATPVAVWGGLARLTRFGLVARTGDFLDALARVDTVCLDKTGTLSTDRLQVKTWRTEPAFTDREAWLHAVVAVMEDGLPHPAARALQEKCHVIRDTFPVPLLLKKREVRPGFGVVGVVTGADAEAVTIAIGEPALGVAMGKLQSSEAEKCHVLRDTFSGKVLTVFVDGQVAAHIELSEQWREGMGDALAELTALGVSAEVLSGDPRAAEILAGFDVPVRSGVAPADKLTRVKELVGIGRCVAFFGDGVNDAAAMSAADVSVAMRGGTELARASAMAVFAGEDWRFIPHAIRIARATRRGIRANLWFASIYNIIGMALAAGGVLHPVAAALLMVGSSVVVSVRAMRSSAVE